MYNMPNFININIHVSLIMGIVQIAADALSQSLSNYRLYPERWNNLVSKLRFPNEQPIIYPDCLQ